MFHSRLTNPFTSPPGNAAAVRNGLTDHGISVETAERWCDAWGLEAAGRGLARDRDYWTAGAEWIAAERAMRRPGWTDRSRRTIHLPSPALTALREQRRRQVEMRLAAGRRWRDLDIVFTAPIGTPLDASKVLQTYHAAAARADLPSRPFHHLRHFAARTLLEAGEDLYTVSRVLGHASITTTADVYGHVTPATLRRSAERMDEAMAR